MYAIKKQITAGEALNLSKAGKEAGYTTRQHAHKAVQGGTFQAAIAEAFEHMHAELENADLAELSAKCIAEGLSATKTTVKKHDGTLYQITSPDYAVRLNYITLDLTIRLLSWGMPFKEIKQLI